MKELREERKNVGGRHKKIEDDKCPTQRRIEQRREAITGNATVSSKNDLIKWGTHTPVPTGNEDDESEDDATN